MKRLIKKINKIEYIFKWNTKYKIYYNFEHGISNDEYSFNCLEFFTGKINNINQVLVSEQNNYLIISKNTIVIYYGGLLKLEELQE